MIMTDFKSVFNSVNEDGKLILQMKGCLFHFGQSLMKNVNKLGLKQSYQKDQKIKDWIKSIFMLALIPLNDVNDAFKDVETQTELEN